jgi:hypothetical protein
MVCGFKIIIVCPRNCYTVGIQDWPKLLFLRLLGTNNLNPSLRYQKGRTRQTELLMIQQLTSLACSLCSNHGRKNCTLPTNLNFGRFFRPPADGRPEKKVVQIKWQSFFAPARRTKVVKRVMDRAKRRWRLLHCSAISLLSPSND